MKNLCLLMVLVNCMALSALAQPTVLYCGIFDNGANTTPSSFNYRMDLTDLGAFRQVRFLANTGGSFTYAFHAGNAGAPDYNTNWRPYSAIDGAGAISLNTWIDPSTNVNSARYNSCSFCGYDGNLPVLTASKYYTFNIQENAGSDNGMEILETSFNPVSIALVTAAAGTYGSRAVSITTSSTPASGENIFVRYSTDGFISSTIVQATGSGTSWAATIPWQSSAVSFYVYTSPKSLNTINNEVGLYGQVAHDMATLNLGLNGGSNFSWTPASGNIIVSSTGGTGAGGVGYASFTLAGGVFATLNAGTAHTGAVTALITADVTTETGLNVLNNSAIWTSLGIIPTGVRTVSGSVANGAVLKLNGADYVTIDGSSNGGTDKSLTITNTNTVSTLSATIWMASLGLGAGATNNTIKNCNISTGTSGSGSIQSIGIYIADNSGAQAGDDNDNITIQNNTITKAYEAIYAYGTTTISAGGTDNLTITGNTIGPSVSGSSNIGFAGIDIDQALNVSITNNTIQNLSATQVDAGGINLLSGITGATVSGNTIKNITSTAPADDISSICALYIGSQVTNVMVDANTFTGIVNTNTTGYASRGIIVNTANASSNVTIQNNMISDIYCYTDVNSIYWPMGIDIDNNSGGINVYYNSVHLFGTHPGYSLANNATGAAALFASVNATNLDIRDNILVNSYDNSTRADDKSYAIYTLAATNSQFTTINYNDYYVSGTPGVLGRIGGVDRTTLAAIITGFGGNANSVNIAPVFTSNTDLHLTVANSSLDNLGAAITGITTDFDGDTRSLVTPDMGADEFSICSATNFTWLGISDDWNTPGNWCFNQVPTSTVDVTIPSGTPNNPSIYLTADAAAKSITINSGATLTLAGVYNLTIAGGGSFSNSGGFTASGTGAVIFDGTGTVAGSVNTNFKNLTINGNAAFTKAPVFNGNFIINAGIVTGNAPTYNTGSLLQYNTGAVYNRSIEWSAASGAGYPYNVQVSNNTSLIPGGSSNTGTALNMANNLTIDAGASLLMDNGSNDMTVPLTVNGAVTLNGNLNASDNSGGTIVVKGNWVNNTGAVFTPKTRSVTFNGTGTQSVGGTQSTTFDDLIISNASNPVTQNADVTVAQILNLNNILSLNGRILNLNGTITGSGTLTGSNTSTLNLGGTGNSMGTLSFTNLSQLLNTISINRKGGSSADPSRVILGSSLAANNITLTNGIIVTGTNNLFTFNNSGGALIQPVSYDSSFIATCDASGTPLALPGPMGLPFTGAYGFRIKTVGNSNTFFPVGPTYLPAGSGLTPSPNRMMINNAVGAPDFTVVVNKGDITGTAGAIINRIWYVKSSSDTGQVDMRLYFTERNPATFGSSQDEVESGYDYSDIRLVQRDYSSDPNFISVASGNDILNGLPFADGTETFAQYTAGATNSIDNLGRTIGLTEFNRFSIANNGNIILPVTITNLRAALQNTSVAVNWTSVRETNIDHYEIERSINGISFNSIGSKAALNNGSIRTDYGFLDIHPQSGDNYYRIKVVEKDGRISYTNVVLITTTGGSIQITIQPNPVKNGNAMVRFTNAPEGKYNLILYSNSGQKVWQRSLGHLGGSADYSIKLPVSIAKGIYFIHVENEAVQVVQQLMVE